MIYGYIRVSTDKQTVENQRFEINEFCRKNSTTANALHQSNAFIKSLLYRVKKYTSSHITAKQQLTHNASLTDSNCSMSKS